MHTSIFGLKSISIPNAQQTLFDVQKDSVVQESCLNRPMSEIGRMNNENSKATINSVARGLRAAIKRFKVPAIVAVTSSKRAPHDLVIWPIPGALIRKTPINCLHWTNTPKRSNAIFWSRELNGSRAWPKQRVDKVLGLARFADRIEGRAWLAIATRATSADGDMLCRWVPRDAFMSYRVKGASMPALAFFQYPAAPYNSKERRFEISAELLAQILGCETGVAS